MQSVGCCRGPGPEDSVPGMRFVGGAALAAVTVLALTGCGSQAVQPTSTPTVTVAPSTPAAVASPVPTVTETISATPEPTTTPVGVDPNRPANQCADDVIGVSVGLAPGGGGAGSEYYEVYFTNTGGTACALRGTPGVSVVGDGNGTQLGKPADRIETGVTTLTLQAGDTVEAPLKIVNIGTTGGPLAGCTVKRGDGYRVYPPHSLRAFFVRDSSLACVSGPSFMTVGPVVPRSR
jgi:hypothetical protein